MAPKSKHKDEITRALSNALREVFGEGEDKKRFIDVSRIPLICKSIIEIREDMKVLKDHVTQIDGKEAQEQKEREKEQQQKDRWKDWASMVVANAIVFLIILILMRTEIINIK